MLPRGLRMLGRRTGPGEKDWQKFAMQTGEGKVFHRREQWAVNRQITEARWGWTGGRKQAGKASRANRNMRPCLNLQTETKLPGKLRRLAFERKKTMADSCQCMTKPTAML